MDFAFSEEQDMLRQQARSFLADKFSPERVAELAQSDAGWDPGSWSSIAELGWIGLSAPEEAGGAGMTFLDEAVVLEELGTALYPGPYFSTVALALPALEQSPELLARVVAGETAATLAWAEAGASTSLTNIDGSATTAREEGGSWLLSGTKVLVPDLGAAGIVVVTAIGPEGPGLWAVDLSTLSGAVGAVSTMDATRRYGTLTLKDAPAELLAGPDSASEVMGRIHLRALAALAVEAVGIGQRALDLAKLHATERTQFDRPIGAYQAVAHQVADTYMGVELARSMAYWAAWCVAEADPQAATAAAAAKSVAAEIAVAACERSIQVHGGIGFTWEHILHRYYKRAQWIDAFEGFGTPQRAAVADALLA
jgi:alkylation response protein AidB-like acyl-CoA dehydrogenase